MLASNTKLPLDFRLHDVTYVMQSLQAKKSCALIGVNGVGKSILMRHLVTGSVRAHYLRERDAQFLFLFINSHELSQPSALAYYRRMAHALEPTLEQLESSLSSYDVFSMKNEPMVQNALFERVRAIVNHDEQRIIVFFFDEFDVALTEVEPHFFRVLKALRDEAHGRVCYVVACSNQPTLLIAQQSRQTVCDTFAELFDGKICGIKPFGERDAYAVIEGTLALTEYNMPQTLRRYCLDLAGAHPGLLKSVVSAFVEGRLTMQFQSKELVLQTLLGDMSITGRCELLWNSLSEIEQRCLKQMGKGLLARSALERHLSTQQAHEAIRNLLLKGVLIVIEPDKTYQCFSALFAEYIVQRFPPSVQGIQLDAAKRQVWIDGVLLPKSLPKHQFKLFLFLASCADQVCPRDETSKAVYGGTYTPGLDDGRLDALVERTRKSIGDDQRKPRFIKTVHGEGHSLKEYLGSH